VTAPRERYAILFSGSTDRRHINNLEYCYRMLVQRYLFKPANILVLNFDKSFTVTGLSRRKSTATKWPDETSADSTKLMMPQPFDTANRAGFQNACQFIGPVQPNDLVFIYTGGHGSASVDNGLIYQPRLIDYQRQPYYASDFCVDLGLLGAPQSLLILMQQCYSGEFIGPVLAALGLGGTIKAQTLSIACASMAAAHATDDGVFDCFALGWITSHLQTDPYGVPPLGTVDLDTDGSIEASESYLYAEKVTSNQDGPVYADHPPSGAVSSAVNAPALLGPGNPSAADIQLS
jgi:hypothetical protein